MINSPIKKNNWILITIDDSNFLSGNSVFDIIQMMLKVINFKFIILDYVYGARISSLKENIVLKIDDFLKLVLEVEQFEWGDFFLFEKYPKNWENPKGKPYPYVISQTSTTVRAVDGQYFYIYTNKELISLLIKTNYTIESIRIGFLEELDYPE